MHLNFSIVPSRLLSPVIPLPPLVGVLLHLEVHGIYLTFDLLQGPLGGLQGSLGGVVVWELLTKLLHGGQPPLTCSERISLSD